MNGSRTGFAINSYLRLLAPEESADRIPYRAGCTWEGDRGVLSVVFLKYLKLLELRWGLGGSEPPPPPGET